MQPRSVLFVLFLLISCSRTYSTQRPASDDSNPFFDMASSFLQEALTNQNNGGGGGGGGMGGIASIIGSMMQGDSGSGKSDSTAQILSGIGSFIANAAASSGKGGGGFDPSMIGNVIQMFTAGAGASSDDEPQRKKRSNEGPGWESYLQLAATVIGNMNGGSSDSEGEKQGAKVTHPGESLMNMMPMVMQAISSFSGPEMEKTQEKHKEHAWVLPPFLENIHMAWDHFSNSELADALWTKMGISSVFKGFVGRDGKLDFDKLFDSLENQSFRRRWIKSATVYLADWANYIANPEVYQRYFATGQMMINGFLGSQGYPKTTHLDVNKPSESLTNLINHVAKRHLNAKIDAKEYVQPTVSYIKELLKLGQARGLLQKFNSTELSDKLTDTFNLEVIEPVLRVHRAYRYALEDPQCDKFVLCEINSHDPNEQLGLGGFKSGMTRFGSMAAAWFVSAHTKTPFWSLFGVINDPYECQVKFPVDCTGFHENEAKVTTEYVHNEL